jgi:hypothetical protein
MSTNNQQQAFNIKLEELLIQNKQRNNQIANNNLVHQIGDSNSKTRAHQ